MLVLAHYQTSPSDIRLILDHPAIHLSIVEHESNVLAVVLLICEGGIDDPDIAQAIIEGRRRPRGHLVPQTLTASTGIAGLLAQKTFRVMRIAVHPSTTRRGLGSKLIQASVQLALHHKIDYLSASFGFTPELMAFWAKNQCQLVRIGYHKDSASGMQSSIVTRSFTEPMTKHLHQCRAIFRQHFVMGMSSLYRYLDWQIVHGALMALELEPKKPDSLDHSKIKAFAQHFRSFEDSTPALIRFVLNSYSNHSIKQLSSQQQQLLIIKLLQGRSWKTTLEVLKLKGKKVADQQLRNTIDTLPG